MRASARKGKCWLERAVRERAAFLESGPNADKVLLVGWCVGDAAGTAA